VNNGIAHIMTIELIQTEKARCFAAIKIAAANSE